MLARVRIVVDLNRCQGYAQCCFLAPDVFRLHGEEALAYHPNPDDGLRLDVLRAAAAAAWRVRDAAAGHRAADVLALVPQVQASIRRPPVRAAVDEVGEDVAPGL